MYTEDPLILHTRSGRLINYIEDEEHGVRLFWQPPVKDGEEVDPEKVEFLHLGMEEFNGRAAPRQKRQSGLMRLVSALEDKFKPLADGLEKWAVERKAKTELDLKLIDQELEFIEAEICLEETIEDMELELKMKQEEEEKRAESEEANELASSAPGDAVAEGEEEDEEEDEEEEGAAPSSFGTVPSTEATGRKRKNGFSSLSLSLPSLSAVRSSYFIVLIESSWYDEPGILLVNLICPCRSRRSSCFRSPRGRGMPNLVPFLIPLPLPCLCRRARDFLS